jgi:hypothetical protein
VRILKSALTTGTLITSGTLTTDASFNLLVSATSNLRLTASNVGINQTTPLYPLDVSGTGRFTSPTGIYFGVTGARLGTDASGNFYTVNNAGTVVTWGATGYTGYTGPTGYTGYTGYTGPTGYTGYTGYTGPTGYTGYTGYTGPTG